MSQLFELPDPVVAPVAGGGAGFPVRRIFCVGRNYEAHAREMGKDPDRDPPFFFTKFAETVCPDGAVIPYPPGTSNYHYEAELVVAIDKSGRNIPVEAANDYVFGYATGLDMTRRDLQLTAREQGRPWDTGKNFEESAPLGLIHPASETGYLDSGAIWLKVNGETKQEADLADLIYTGTPAGVGPVVAGDTIDMHIDGLTPLQVKIAEAV